MITGVASSTRGSTTTTEPEHALELGLKPLAAEEARAAATEFVCGQTYFGDAHVVIVLFARSRAWFLEVPEPPKSAALRS